MSFGIVVFPGSNCDADTEYALGTVLGADVQLLWHADETVDGVDCVVLPGGFAYGDYLRAGAIARFSPVMRAVQRHADAGGLVLGICNGFQVLVEAGLLPGALLRNRVLEFRCRWVGLRVERTDTPFTNAYAPGEIIRMPIAHGEGRYYADHATLERLEAHGQVVLRYCPQSLSRSDCPIAAAEKPNPNGSVHDIAGLVNERGNVFGLMPHPERCCEALVGGDAGLRLFQSIVRAVGRQPAAVSRWAELQGPARTGGPASQRLRADC
jgi:phosphoribosylformylglycinamidine synthase subunit PurQ / glutaminase